MLGYLVIQTKTNVTYVYLLKSTVVIVKVMQPNCFLTKNSTAIQELQSMLRNCITPKGAIELEVEF